MKTLTVSDADYETLMQLSKELQIQDNNFQAFPYFWEPSSKKLVHNMHDEGEVLEFVVDGETFDSECVYENEESIREEFLKENELSLDTVFESVESEDWEEYLKEHCDIEVYTSDWERKQEHNPSLFMSDVKNFVECNKHHLGKDPHTYSRSIWRMPKMQSLVECVLRLNKTHGEKVNHEAERFLK